ncbi:tyrosine-type recombinase/integrase [Emcibacter sp.]|uniref:tyrosine-type recombinase/integrase n=1 Tax=Emcibacter sp. TaxID=1979954 RepID=UPI002AA9537D|nr:tyrosine-type recombinase/integrase [Emcibacter sp.]
MEEAKRIAEEIYDELRYKHQNQKNLSAASFRKVAADFIRKVERETTEGRLSKGRRNLIVGTVDRYLNPFFGRFFITEIRSAHFAEYDEWRLDYWTVGYGAERQVYRKAEVPSQKTLVMEQGILRQVFKHAVERGWLSAVPFMQSKSAKTNRRSAFDIHEYKLLMRVMLRRIRETRHPRVQHDRALLALYVRLMSNTGMRVGEARHLKWGDIEIVTLSSNGKSNEVLRIWVDGKTGKRALIGTTVAKYIIQRLLKFYEYGSLQEARDSGGYLFVKTSGELVQTFEVGFKRLLEACGLETDRYGKNRTLYSLRHTYATYRLLYGGVDVYLLARNMGTSVQMIERHYGHVTTSLAADKLL